MREEGSLTHPRLLHDIDDVCRSNVVLPPPLSTPSPEQPPQVPLQRPHVPQQLQRRPSDLGVRRAEEDQTHGVHPRRIEPQALIHSATWQPLGVVGVTTGGGCEGGSFQREADAPGVQELDEAEEGGVDEAGVVVRDLEDEVGHAPEHREAALGEVSDGAEQDLG